LFKRDQRCREEGNDQASRGNAASNSDIGAHRHSLGDAVGAPRAAAEPIKIGMPLALTGPLGSVGQQLKRGGEMWAKVQNANGGLLGRPVQREGIAPASAKPFTFY
jgi:ABC-type branched-subunit amino acid transport system substrate-binding protein